MREISLGQYYPVSSPIHRMDPRTKLVISIAYLVMIFFVDTFVGFGVVALFLFATVLLSRVPFLKVIKSLKVIILLVLFTTLLTLLFYRGERDDLLWEWQFIHIYRAQLISCGLTALRIIFLVLGPTVLTYTTTPVALCDGLESLLKPLTWVGIPVHYLAIIMSIALRLIPTFTEETDKIINAQKARGADFDSGNLFKRAKAMVPILIPLIFSSMRRADELADAMDSRCYRGAKGRTRLKQLRFSWRDPLLFLLFAAQFLLILWIKYNFLPFVDLTALGWIV